MPPGPNRAASPRGSAWARARDSARRPAPGRWSRARRRHRAGAPPVHRVAAPVGACGEVARAEARIAQCDSPAPTITCFAPAGQCTKSHRRNGRSTPSITSTASPARTRKSSWSASQWYIAMGSPGPSTCRLIPTWGNSGSPSKQQIAPRPLRSAQTASRAFSTNQPSPAGTNPCPVCSRSASRMRGVCRAARIGASGACHAIFSSAASRHGGGPPRRPPPRPASAPARRRARRRPGARSRSPSGRRAASRPGSGASATPAIWGRWVITSTCAASATCCSLPATARAVRPPIAGVDLVEQQHPGAGLRPRGHPDGERDARQLAARRRVGHAARRADPGSRPARARTRSAPRGPRSAGSTLHAEARLRHAEVGQLRLDGTGERRRRARRGPPTARPRTRERARRPPRRRPRAARARPRSRPAARAPCGPRRPSPAPGRAGRRSGARARRTASSRASTCSSRPGSASSPSTKPRSSIADSCSRAARVAQLGGDRGHARLVRRRRAPRPRRPARPAPARPSPSAGLSSSAAAGRGRRQLVQVPQPRALGAQRARARPARPRAASARATRSSRSSRRRAASAACDRAASSAAAPRRAARATPSAIAASLRLAAGVAVEQLELARRLGEPPGLVLRRHLEQPLAERLQIGPGARPAPHERTAAAARRAAAAPRRACPRRRAQAGAPPRARGSRRTRRAARTRPRRTPRRRAARSARPSGCAPARRPIASASIVLPAPVSPVSTFSPGAGSRSARSIRARFSMWRRSSIAFTVWAPARTASPRRSVAERLQVAAEERRPGDAGEAWRSRRTGAPRGHRPGRRGRPCGRRR